MVKKKIIYFWYQPATSHPKVSPAKTAMVLRAQRGAYKALGHWELKENWHPWTIKWVCISSWLHSVSKQIFRWALSDQNMFDLESFIKMTWNWLHSLAQASGANPGAEPSPSAAGLSLTSPCVSYLSVSGCAGTHSCVLCLLESLVTGGDWAQFVL